jgi:serine/threonine protein phosphatase PrpC
MRGEDLGCPRCRETIRPGDRFCEACGAPIEAGAGSSEDAGTDGPPVPGPPADGREHREIAFADLVGITDRGLRRGRNEDALAMDRVESQGARIMVVCDGVSTSAEPALASQAAADAALAHLKGAVAEGHPNLELAMRDAAGAAQRAVCRVPFAHDGEEGPPATTLVAALLMDGRATLGWVGDSRAYFVGESEAWQLSHDDTWLEDVVLGEPLPNPPREGEGGSRGEGAQAVQAHVLTRWLGQDLEGDPELSVTTFQLPAEGCLLLCSDGLWNYAPTPALMRKLVAELSAGSTLPQLARGLVEFALAAGGADNVTVAVASVGPRSEEDEEEEPEPEH